LKHGRREDDAGRLPYGPNSINTINSIIIINEINFQLSATIRVKSSTTERKEREFDMNTSHTLKRFQARFGLGLLGLMTVLSGCATTPRAQTQAPEPQACTEPQDAALKRGPELAECQPANPVRPYKERRNSNWRFR